MDEDCENDVDVDEEKDEELETEGKDSKVDECVDEDEDEEEDDEAAAACAIVIIAPFAVIVGKSISFQYPGPQLKSVSGAKCPPCTQANSDTP